MVYIVKDNRPAGTFLSIKKSYRDGNKIRTKHIAYLGKASRLTKGQIDFALAFYKFNGHEVKDWKKAYKEEKRKCSKSSRERK